MLHQCSNYLCLFRLLAVFPQNNRRPSRIMKKQVFQMYMFWVASVQVESFTARNDIYFRTSLKGTFWPRHLSCFWRSALKSVVFHRSYWKWRNPDILQKLNEKCCDCARGGGRRALRRVSFSQHNNTKRSFFSLPSFLSQTTATRRKPWYRRTLKCLNWRVVEALLSSS